MGCVCEVFYALSERHYKITSRLIKLGFLVHKVCVAFKKNILEKSQAMIDIFSKHKVYLPEHIREGICLTLVAKNIYTY